LQGLKLYIHGRQIYEGFRGNMIGWSFSICLFHVLVISTRAAKG